MNRAPGIVRSLRSGSLLALATCVLVTGLWTRTTHAAPKTTPCPRFIAEKSGEIYYPRENYKCFKSSRDAERAGLLGTRALIAPDYSGWWRWDLTLDSNTCGGPRRLPSPTTYFLQLKHDSASGLFGSLCPGNDTFVGAAPARNPSLGFSITSTNTVQADPFCAGGPASISYIFEARTFDAFFTAAKAAKLTQITTCDGPNNRRCRATWSGSGARETTDHRFWPQISNNVNDLGKNCGLALSTCQGCHAAPTPP